MSTERRLEDVRSLLINEAAAALGVSRRTVYYQIQKGLLETVRTRLGSQRVLLSSIDRLRADGRFGAAAPPDQR